MREIDVSKIKEAVSELFLKANFELRKDILAAIKAAFKKETNESARGILKSIIENALLAKKKTLAICQDTGVAVIHLELGQDVALVGGDLKTAIDEGVEEAYRKGCLRKSVVADPLSRENTQTNAPSIVYIDMVEGDRVKVAVSPKGFGSENKSAIKMFRPTASTEEIKEFVMDTVIKAGPDACPPLVLGIGIGGTFETAALLSKKALFRPIDRRNPKRHLAGLERGLVKDINGLGMGPMGLGGKTTVLGVNIMESHTHIAGLPVAVNVGCHATRGAEKTL